MTSITARAGRWSAAHRKLAIGGWLAFVIAAVFAGGMAGFKSTDDNTGTGSSGRADAALNRAFPDQPTEAVLVQAKPGQTLARDTVSDVVRRLRADKHVRSTRIAASKPGSALIDVRTDDDDGAIALLDTTHAAQSAHKDVFVGQFGDNSLDDATSNQAGSDLGKAESLSIPFTLVLLLLSFGSIVAALVPLGLALSAVAAANGITALLSHSIAMTDTVSSVIMLIGLAVGVDYSLFYLRREREERRAGYEPGAALRIASATSGHAVLVSGLTVIIAMAGMFLAGSAIFTALALGSIIVVAVALLASVTVLPAVLSGLGDRVEKGRMPFRRKRERRAGPTRFWTVVLGGVVRRPVVSVVVAGSVLIALTIPALGMKTALPGMDSVSDSLAVKQTYNRIEKTFPGGGQPATVVVRAKDVTIPQIRAAIAELHPVETRISPDKTVVRADVKMPGDGTDARSVQALERLRTQTLPATIGRVPGAKADVTGFTAGSTDFRNLMHDRAPIVFAFVLGLAFILLLVTFRSVVIPVKAIVLNLLSVAAAYGVLSLAFDEPITAWLPMFLFVILFGLSMDYHVFIVSRIRELRMAGRTTQEAVEEGIKSTAGVVTSAAAIMIAVFSAFGMVSSVEMQQMGIGLAAAVFIDATLIRAVLLPATMTLLGEANWWWPGRARRPAEAPRAAAPRVTA